MIAIYISSQLTCCCEVTFIMRTEKYKMYIYAKTLSISAHLAGNKEEEELIARTLRPVVGRLRPAVGRPRPAVGRLRPVVGRLRPAVGRPRPAVGRLRPAVNRLRPVVGRPRPALDMPHPAEVAFLYRKK